jgi:hypothetical protein
MGCWRDYAKWVMHCVQSWSGIKMLKNQTNNHHVQNDTFEFVEAGDHEAQDQCSLWGQ